MPLPLRHTDIICNLYKGTLREALTVFFPQYRKRKYEDPEYLRRCVVCFLKGLCEQCPAKSWMKNGTIDTPVEYLCVVVHAQARYLGLVRVDEKAWEVTDGLERVELFSKKSQEK